MPLDLALLPFVESSFETHAFSKDQAAGVWQFMSIASKRFNLRKILGTTADWISMHPHMLRWTI